jgi:hypothetical protein
MDGRRIEEALLHAKIIPLKTADDPDVLQTALSLAAACFYRAEELCAFSYLFEDQ